MKVYINFIVSNFIKSFFYVSLIVLSLVFILNLLTEIEFFREFNVKSHIPLYISLLNSPSLLFEMFPFIFLVSTQVFFVNLFNNDQIQIFKYSGLKNIKILSILLYTSFAMGILIILIFYNFSSNLKNIYLEIKNEYTSDENYLAVITKNGLWIKDSIENKTNIIHASKMNEKVLINTYITELDEDFNVIRHLESEEINITKKKWILKNVKIYFGNERISKDLIFFDSNFDYKKIKSLFSNLSSLSIIQLYDLRKNYKLLNYSTTEVDIQIQKVISYPLYLALMTILSAVVMFNTKNFNSITLKISIGLFLSVLIYYINNFFNVLGKTEKISILSSIWIPLISLFVINLILTFKINEK